MQPPKTQVSVAACLSRYPVELIILNPLNFFLRVTSATPPKAHLNPAMVKFVNERFIALEFDSSKVNTHTHSLTTDRSTCNHTSEHVN
jgi:hypothetical protein